MIVRIEDSKLKDILEYAKDHANFEVNVSELDYGQYSGQLEEIFNFNGQEITFFCDYNVSGTWTREVISTFECSSPSEWIFSSEDVYCVGICIDGDEIDLYPEQQKMLENLLSSKCYSEFSY